MDSNAPASERSVDEHWMALALLEARIASAKGEVPVGCVLVRSGEVVGRGHNLRQTTFDPTAHAEILAIREAATAQGDWRLDGTTAFVTLEPCAMCAGALVLARVDRVVYGADDLKAGGVTSLFSIGRDPRLNHQFELTRGVLAEESAAELRGFFSRLRAQGKK
jgi:tRNA(adenine34) deaminase